jgi:hypothetical protein
MRAVEFESSITREGQIELPAEVTRQIPAGEQIRVVVMWESPDSDSAWRAAGRQRFAAPYCPEDEIYEKLLDDACRVLAGSKSPGGNRR